MDYGKIYKVSFQVFRLAVKNRRRRVKVGNNNITSLSEKGHNIILKTLDLYSKTYTCTQKLLLLLKNLYLYSKLILKNIDLNLHWCVSDLH